MDLDYTPRSELAYLNWDPERKEWKRPSVEKETLKTLTKRSTLNGLLRVAYFVALLAVPTVGAFLLWEVSPWLALLCLYAYYFLTGFWVAIGHELQHKTVFARAFEPASEVFFFFVQWLMWNSPRYARVSHVLHHQYTMVRGVDPETNWPEVFTTKFLNGILLSLASKVLVIGGLVDLYRLFRQNLLRSQGIQDKMMEDHCSPADLEAIRWESTAILLIHTVIAVGALAMGWWPVLLFVTLAWPIGAAFEALWHVTEHIGRLYDVNDQRAATRSIKVNPFLRTIYWGLDDHVEHHLYPAVPSKNLPRLHKLLNPDVAPSRGLFGCWREMYAIAREKERRPQSEYVPVKSFSWSTGAKDRTIDDTLGEG